MVFPNPWLTFSLMFLIVWFVIWIVRGKLRKEMLQVSFITSLFGFTEPLFVPEYWNPPSLFNLATRTGFDIESLIFCFAVGGIGSVIYEFLTKKRHKKIRRYRKDTERYRLHLMAIFSMPVFFIFLIIFSRLNPIYSAIIAMFIGSVFAILCRPDLKARVFIGGASFFILYFVFFLLFNLMYPGLVQEVWSLSVLSGILLLGVPLEELLFAFTFGMLWSTYYEHLKWYK